MQHLPRLDRIIEAEEMFLIWSNSPIGLAIVGKGGEWLYVNDAMCDIVEYTSTELYARTFQAVTHPEDVDVDVGLLKECLAGKRDSYSMAKRYITKTGRVRWVNLSVNVSRHEDGVSVKHFVAQVVAFDPYGVAKVTNQGPGRVQIEVKKAAKAYIDAAIKKGQNPTNSGQASKTPSTSQAFGKSHDWHGFCLYPL